MAIRIRTDARNESAAEKRALPVRIKETIKIRMNMNISKAAELLKRYNEAMKITNDAAATASNDTENESMTIMKITSRIMPKAVSAAGFLLFIAIISL